MALETYDDLKDAVAGWLDRTDLTARIPDFISLCDARLRRLVSHDVGLSDTVTFSVTSSGRELPEDFNGVIYLKSADTNFPRLDFVPPQEYAGYLNDQSGIARVYTIIGSKLFIYPESDVELTMAYRTKVDLAQYGPNWILENHPDAYVYGSLVAAEPYIVEDERLPMWKAMFEEAITEINEDGRKLTYPGPLQMTANGISV
jgi:hypothetical protein